MHPFFLIWPFSFRQSHDGNKKVDLPSTSNFLLNTLCVWSEKLVQCSVLESQYSSMLI